jgi:hypothetical protein
MDPKGCKPERHDFAEPSRPWRQVQLWLVLLISLSVAGCVSRSKATANAQKAYLDGQQRAILLQQQAQELVVSFRGQVRNPRVPWTEGLTLAQALLAADYTGRLDPRKIQIIRQGEFYSINVRRLLRGQENPVLEPGDTVEVTQ